MKDYERYSEQIKALYNRKLSLSVNQELMEMTFKYSDKSKIENQIKNRQLLELESKVKYILKCPNCLDGTVKKENDNRFESVNSYSIIKCNRCNGTKQIAVLEEDLSRYITRIEGL